jgi:hypothetical protein
MASLAFRHADQAGSELERCVTKLGFKWVMVNGCSQTEASGFSAS